MNSPARVPRTTPDTIRMPTWIRWSIYGATITFTVTGMIWVIAHFLLVAPGEIENPLEPWMLRIHGMAVMFGLFMYGSLLRPHITKGWHAKKGRRSGITVLAIIGALTVSGYMLYYAGSEQTRPIISMVHWIIGLFFPIWLPIHIWRRRAKAGQEKRTGERRALSERRTFLGFGAQKPSPKKRVDKDRREKADRRVAPATDMPKSGPDRRKSDSRRKAPDRRGPRPPDKEK